MTGSPAPCPYTAIQSKVLFTSLLPIKWTNRRRKFSRCLRKIKCFRNRAPPCICRYSSFSAALKENIGVVFRSRGELRWEISASINSPGKSVQPIISEGFIYLLYLQFCSRLNRSTLPPLLLVETTSLGFFCSRCFAFVLSCFWHLNFESPDVTGDALIIVIVLSDKRVDFISLDQEEARGEWFKDQVCNSFTSSSHATVHRPAL